MKCSKAGFNATVITIKKSTILVHFVNVGNKKSTINAMKTDMITMIKLDNTVPSIVSINEIIAEPARSF